MWQVGVAGRDMARRRDASALSLILIAAMLSACGASDRSAAEAAEAPAWREMDACQFLTRDEVQGLTGTIVDEPTLTAHSAESTHCVWMAAIGPPVATLFLAHEAAADVPNLEDVQRSRSESQIVDGLGSAALWTPALGDLEVWAYGQKLQLGNPGIQLNEAQALMERALERVYWR